MISHFFRKMRSMSVERNVGRAVLDLSDLVKTEVVQCISLLAREGSIKLTDLEVRDLAKNLNATIDGVFHRGVDGVLRAAGSKRN